MIGSNKKNIVIGISRVRNVEFIINDVLNYLNKHIDGVIVYDDASTDRTIEILNNHSLVREVISNKEWESDRIRRNQIEGEHRQILFEAAKKHAPDWIYVFDADEFIEFKENLDLNDTNFDSYFFRLYDYYITPDDVDVTYKDRLYIGPEYRDIPMLFRSNLHLDFNSRVPTGFGRITFGGYVKHYGKAISVSEWDKKCYYYINHLKENQPGNIDISEKWTKRLGKAIHTKSDFSNNLIKWDDKEMFGIELTNGLERISSLKLNVLVATNSLNRLGGSETFTYTIIEELKTYQEFKVEYFTFNKGVVSDKIENDLGVEFMSLKKYDLILANHSSVVNKLSKKGLIIQTCHGIFPELEQPNKRSDGFIAISQEVQNHLAEKGFASKLIYNSINLNRFYPKKNINQKPKIVLSLCHSELANNTIKNVCKDLNLKYLEAYKYNQPIWDVERLINQSDVVFGLGRSAYEAMSCGRPVIVYDKRHYFPNYGDGYVKENLGFSIINNCSGRYSKSQFTVEELKKEVNKYDFGDQGFFRSFSLKELDVRKNVVKYIEYYFLLKKLKKESGFIPRLKKNLKKTLNKCHVIKVKIIKKLRKFLHAINKLFHLMPCL